MQTHREGLVPAPKGVGFPEQQSMVQKQREGAPVADLNVIDLR